MSIGERYVEKGLGFFAKDWHLDSNNKLKNFGEKVLKNIFKRSEGMIIRSKGKAFFIWFVWMLFNVCIFAIKMRFKLKVYSLPYFQYFYQDVTFHWLQTIVVSVDLAQLRVIFLILVFKFVLFWLIPGFDTKIY